ncbi:MAG: tetratricopeptide repeat protein [Actinomycetia bacterium]|nr:tetratricopeptide repeat protein [Actinomycetes bacterium]
MTTHALSDPEYVVVTESLVRMAGLVFDVSRRGAISAILHERMSKSGHTSTGSYLAHVESAQGAEERQRLLDAVTIQETHFFRNLPQIDALRRDVLPDLLRRSRRTGRQLTIWSAGCSTGEEPYTLAMLLVQLFEETGPFPVRIIGTDVSAAALDVARAGVYSGRTIQLAEPGAVERWFDARSDGSYSVAQPVRDLVEFRLQNLVTDEPPFDTGEVDLVVCRNVTIYFGRETTARLVRGFHRLLTVGGYLLLGHAETLWQISGDFSLLPVGEAFVYRKDVVPQNGRRLSVGLPAAPPPAAPQPRRVMRDVLRVPSLRPRRVPTPTPTPAPPARPVAPPVASPLQDLTKARDALNAGSYAEAASLAERATAAHPLLVEGYIIEGRALSNQGDDDGAIAALRKAVFLDPTAAHAHFLLATTLARVGDPGGAALSFASAAETLPQASSETLSELLDGRAVSDLVDLCRQLAVSLQSDPEPVVGASAASHDDGRRR